MRTVSHVLCRGLAWALWTRCPAHDDRLPSLSLANGHDGRLLLYCYAGCSFREIIQALIRIGLLGKQAYDQTLSLSKQFCADFKRATHRRINDDGLLHRFQMLVCLDDTKDW